MPLQQTSGAASYDAFGGGAPVAAKYIEDFFQTWLRTGTSSSTTITTGLNGAINKTMVWTKSRSAATNHKLTDNVRGATKALSSNTTAAEVTDSQGLTAFSSTGYTIGTNTDYNNSGATYVDWQWVATPKFFDVVTWTATGSEIVNHNLQSVPGCVIYKNTSGISNWFVVSRKSDNSYAYALLNTTSAAGSVASPTAAGLTSTTFDPSQIYGTLSGQTYVGYFFAHNAGGFGLTGTDNVISCGSYTEGASAQDITLGYEPQWLLMKRSNGASDWYLYDTMRGMSYTQSNALVPNTADPEANFGVGFFRPTATGFTALPGYWGSGASVIYIAIRRGPMRVPTDGTSVFAPVTQTSTGSAQSVTTNFPVDFTISRVRGATSANYVIDRLRGSTSASARILISNTTDPEYSGGPGFSLDSNTKITDNGLFGAGSSVIYECFRRAPGFFDVVCYTGDGANRTVAHNLGVAPELMIVKRRETTGAWRVYAAPLGPTEFLGLNETSASVASSLAWDDTTPTSTVFSLGAGANLNASGGTYVNYLFASCPGVSKVGSYTGTGTTQTINCGFTGGARFVMIKATSTTGNWLTFDTARGMTALTDPFLSLNNTAAETATLGACTTVTTGFAVNESILAGVNTSGVSYIFLSVA